MPEKSDVDAILSLDRRRERILEYRLKLTAIHCRIGNLEEFGNLEKSGKALTVSKKNKLFDACAFTIKKGILGTLNQCYKDCIEAEQRLKLDVTKLEREFDSFINQHPCDDCYTTASSSPELFKDVVGNYFQVVKKTLSLHQDGFFESSALSVGSDGTILFVNNLVSLKQSFENNFLGSDDRVDAQEIAAQEKFFCAATKLILKEKNHDFRKKLCEEAITLLDQKKTLPCDSAGLQDLKASFTEMKNALDDNNSCGFFSQGKRDLAKVTFKGYKFGQDYDKPTGRFASLRQYCS